jgi:hypothetical protein
MEFGPGKKKKEVLGQNMAHKNKNEQTGLNGNSR